MRTIKIQTNVGEYEVFLAPGEYENGRLAFEVMMKDGSRFGVLTVNIPEEPLSDDEIFVKTWSENTSWVGQILVALPDVFEDTKRRVPTGHVEASVWKVKQPPEAFAA